MMPDTYADLRSLPLLAVLSALGFSEWKERKGGSEWYGRCPIHQAKKNNTAFSFDASGKFNCFSCGAKGRGAIDLLMQARKLGFKEAVAWLSTQQVPPVPAAPPSEAKMQLSENVPYKGSYEKFAVPSAWLKERGFTEDTLKRYEVFEYNNPTRRSAYSGSVMLKI